jgi:hypothetical protein
VQPFEGDLLAYRGHIVAQRRAERRKEGKAKASNGALSDAEKRVAQLEREVRASEKAMLKQDFLSKPTAKQQAATQAHAELVAALAAAEEAYLGLLAEET